MYEWVKGHKMAIVVSVIVIVVTLFGVWCYTIGHDNATRDAHIERVHTINDELGQARQAIERATNTNDDARKTVTDGININYRIQDANRRTGEAVANAERIIRETKQGFSTSHELIRECKQLIETARKRTEIGTAQGETQ